MKISSRCAEVADLQWDVVVFFPPSFLLAEKVINLEYLVHDLHPECVYQAVEKDMRRPGFGGLQSILLNQASLGLFDLG